MTDAIMHQLFYWLAWLVGVLMGYGIFKYRHSHTVLSPQHSALPDEMPIIYVRQNG
jgi:hypothetical protein